MPGASLPLAGANFQKMRRRGPALPAWFEAAGGGAEPAGPGPVAPPPAAAASLSAPAPAAARPARRCSRDAPELRPRPGSRSSTKSGLPASRGRRATTPRPGRSDGQTRHRTPSRYAGKPCPRGRRWGSPLRGPLLGDFRRKPPHPHSPLALSAGAGGLESPVPSRLPA